MVYLDTEVRTALITDTVLIGLLGGEKVYQPNQPGDTENKFPAVVFEEISNVPVMGADNIEEMTRVTYRILAYGQETLVPILNAIERVMIGINFVRHSSVNLHDLPVGVRGKEVLFITLRECV